MAWVLTQNNFDVWLAQDLSDFAGTGISWTSNQFLFDTSWGDTHYLSYDITSSNWDHGGLLGLGDDDHLIYALVTGARAFTGDVTIADGQPNLHLSDTDYYAGSSWFSMLFGATAGGSGSLGFWDGTSWTYMLTMYDSGGIDVANSDIVLDEDAMGSDDATRVATQQSIKAYVDSEIAGVSGVSVAQFIGAVTRPKFTYKDANEVYVGPGNYHHSGTSEQMVWWDTTYAITVTSTTGWNYLYIDDSAIVIAGTNFLTASEFIFSTTAPTFDQTKNGWYNGTDRCIFATYCGTASTQSIFYHSGEFVTLNHSVASRALADLDTVWTNVTLSIPAFSEMGWVSFAQDQNADYQRAQYRVDGSSATTGHYVGWGSATNSGHTNDTRVVQCSSQIIEVRMDGPGAAALEVRTNGWLFPEAM